MKTNILKIGVAMSLCIAALASSCSDRIAEDYTPNGKPVPLEVSVAGINKTRSLITGTTLPDTCDFCIFFNSDFGVNVNFEKGNCKLEEPIFLDEKNEPSPVYAFYPDSAYKAIKIDIRNQQDYLRGVSVDSSGNPINVGYDNPKAKILFDHILARITLNIHKDSDIKDIYKFQNIYLWGESNRHTHFEAVYSVIDKSFMFASSTGMPEYDNIKGELKDDKYWLDTSDDVVTVDFLVLPMQASWKLDIKDLSDDHYDLPATKYESGKQYIYDCLIKEDDKPYLTITECDIKPWQSIIKPGVEAY